MFLRACVLLLLLACPAFAEDLVSTYAAPVTGAKDIAFDAAGNLYASGQAGGVGLVSKVGPGGSPISTFATGLVDPWGLAFDTAGNLYVADRGNLSIANSGVIYKVTPGGVKTVFKSALQSPMFLVFDPDGNLYASNWGGHLVYKLTPAAVVSTYATVGAAGEEAGGIAFDAAGNLYAGAGTNLKKVGPGGAPITTVAGGLGEIVGLDVLGDGTVYFGRYSFNDVWTVSPAAVAASFIAAGSCGLNDDAQTYARSAARTFRAASARLHGGRLFIADSGCNRIRVVDFATPASGTTWGQVKSIYRR